MPAKCQAMAVVAAATSAPERHANGQEAPVAAGRCAAGGTDGRAPARRPVAPTPHAGAAAAAAGAAAKAAATATATKPAAPANAGAASAAAPPSQRERMAGLMAAIDAARSQGPAALAACMRELGPQMDGHAVTAAVTAAAQLADKSRRGANHNGRGSTGGGNRDGNSGGSDGERALNELRAEAAALLRARWRLLDGFGLCYCTAALPRLGLGRERCLAADMAAASEAWAHTLPPRVLSQLLWALATLGAPAAPDLPATVLRATGPRLREANAYDCAQLAWALARLRAAPHDAWWDAYFRRVGQVRLPGVKPWRRAPAAKNAFQAPVVCWQSGARGACLSAVPRLHPGPKTPPRPALSRTLSQQLLPAMDAQQLSTVAQAVATLRVKPSDAFTSRLLSAARQLLHIFTPEGLGMLSYAIVIFGARPPAPWRHAFLVAAAAALPRCSSHNLASFCVLLARWQLDPGPAWWGRFFSAGEVCMAAGGYSAQVRGASGTSAQWRASSETLGAPRARHRCKGRAPAIAASASPCCPLLCRTWR
jgi:hypothetical protein